MSEQSDRIKQRMLTAPNREARLLAEFADILDCKRRNRREKIWALLRLTSQGK